MYSGRVVPLAAVGGGVALVLAVVCVMLGVSPWPAIVGAVVGALIEGGAGVRSGTAPGNPAVDRSSELFDPAGRVSASAHGSGGTSWQAPNVPGPGTPGGVIAGSPRPVSLAPSALPPNEVPCPTCGLYPAEAPSPTALPQPGTHQHFGIS